MRNSFRNENRNPLKNFTSYSWRSLTTRSGYNIHNNTPKSSVTLKQVNFQALLIILQGVSVAVIFPLRTIILRTSPNGGDEQTRQK